MKGPQELDAAAVVLAADGAGLGEEGGLQAQQAVASGDEVMSSSGGACSEADWRVWYCFMHVALFNPKMYVYTQKPFFVGNVDSDWGQQGRVCTFGGCFWYP